MEYTSHMVKNKDNAFTEPDNNLNRIQMEEDFTIDHDSNILINAIVKITKLNNNR